MNDQWNQMPPRQNGPVPPNMPPRQNGPVPPNMPPRQNRPVPPNMPPRQNRPVPPNMPPQQGKPQPVPMTPEEKKQANKLCILSMVLMFAPIALVLIVNIIMGVLYDTGVTDLYYALSGSYAVESILTFVVLGCGIAGLILMILVRVKYPQSIFGKVLMWLYIVLAILLIVYIAIVIVACGLAMASCARSCPG